MYVFNMEQISTYINSWQNWLLRQKNYSPKTAESYLIDLRKFLTFIHSYKEAEPDLQILGTLELREFRAYLAERKNNDYCANLQRARAFHQSAVFTNSWSVNSLLKNDAIKHLRISNRNKKLPKAIACTQILELIENYAANNWVERRDKAILTLLYGSGMRM